MAIKMLKYYKVNEVKGHVCGIKMVREEDDLIMISNEGVIIRIAVSDVNTMSRYASGVRVMRLGDSDRVVTFARADHVDEETTAVEKEESPDDMTEEELKAEEAAAEAAEAAEEAAEMEDEDQP